MKRVVATLSAALFLVIMILIQPLGAFEIITEKDLQDNIVIKAHLIPTVDNFIVLYDASGSMDDEYLTGVKKIDAEFEILKQQGALIPELGYQAGLYLFTPFETYYTAQLYNRSAYDQAIDRLPNTKTAGGFSGQPTPLAEGIRALDPILAKLSGTTAVFIFSDGTYTFDRVTKQRPLDVARQLAAKYDICFYPVSSATSPKAEKLLDDIAALTACSRVIPFDALYKNPVWGVGPLYVVNSTLDIETITDRKVVGAKADDINFAFDQMSVAQKDYANLKNVADFLQNNPNTFAVVAGFTDNQGDKAYNLKLSRMRAENTRNAILEQARIDPDRVIMQWYGATNFIASNETAEGRQKNRRVEIAIGTMD